ncbi:TPA: YjcZ family sporulation protein [Bacillus cereus]
MVFGGGVTLLVVLFILLIIIGCSLFCKKTSECLFFLL